MPGVTTTWYTDCIVDIIYLPDKQFVCDMRIYYPQFDAVCLSLYKPHNRRLHMILSTKNSQLLYQFRSQTYTEFYLAVSCVFSSKICICVFNPTIGHDNIGYWNYLLLYWRFLMTHIQNSIKILLIVQCSVWSTASWLVDIGK